MGVKFVSVWVLNLGIKMTKLGIDFDTYFAYNFATNKFRQKFLLFYKSLLNNCLMPLYTYPIKYRRIILMTENELKLLSIIRENDNPERAFETAIEIILKYLNHPESFESTLSVDSLELV